MTQAYYVKAIWDSEASVWISETNIPGLVIEAATLAQFEQLMTELAPEMLAANANVHNTRVPVDFCVADRREYAVV